MYSLLYLEVLIKQQVSIKREGDNIRSSLTKWLLNHQLVKVWLKSALANNGYVYLDTADVSEHLTNCIDKVKLCIDGSIKEVDNLRLVPEHAQEEEKDDGSSARLVVCLYKLFEETMQHSLEQELPATMHVLLPSKSLEGLWESLVFDTNIRSKLLNYVQTSLQFAHQKVNSALISLNKMILLHGPPGTGKTSLCKALAHKFAIRLYKRYHNVQLVEINSHSLFSKWFSESGKLVLKLFDSIREFAEDQSNLIFVLIDEVESIAYDRQRSNSSDPSDAIRVVNALLTQIDSIRAYPNVIILTSSNVTQAMDNAFVDRADLKQHIGMPSEASIYKIYHSCIHELLRTQLLLTTVDSTKDSNCAILNYEELAQAQAKPPPSSSPDQADIDQMVQHSERLLLIARSSINLSGRALRKLPFLAMALFSEGAIPMRLARYLDCLQKAVEKQLEDNKYFN